MSPQLAGGTSIYQTSGSTALTFTTTTVTGTAQGGTSTPIVKAVVQPTNVMNYIIKR